MRLDPAPWTASILLAVVTTAAACSGAAAAVVDPAATDGGGSQSSSSGSSSSGGGISGSSSGAREDASEEVDGARRAEIDDAAGSEVDGSGSERAEAASPTSACLVVTRWAEEGKCKTCTNDSCKQDIDLYTNANCGENCGTTLTCACEKATDSSFCQSVFDAWMSCLETTCAGVCE